MGLSLGFLVGLDHHRALWILGMQPFDIRPHRSDVDATSVDPDLVARVDGDQHVCLVLARRRGRVRAIDVDPRLLDKRRRDDEKNQHNENNVDQRRYVDL